MSKQEPKRAASVKRTRRPATTYHTAAIEAEAASSAMACSRAGCTEYGEYRAPVSPNRTEDHYWFCLEHVREYNKAWNYCAGRTDDEIETMIRNDIVGGRPTWPLGRLGGKFSKSSFNNFKDAFGLFEDEKVAEEAARAAARERARRRRESVPKEHKNERAALDIMELTPPLTVEGLKTRYKELVKRHHPDANGGDKEAEERLKLINQAYATLKQSLGV
ncbi:MAG: hypothetical protein ACI82H_002124 [Alphaproteobacteria bacterium]|jgi:hypothetical protein